MDLRHIRAFATASLITVDEDYLSEMDVLEKA